MPLSNVVFIHGYSETSLGAYFDFPRILRDEAKLNIDDVVLSAFNSLDDEVSITDLSLALEDHVTNLEQTRTWDMRSTAVICHSTGALLARRWILNRIAANSENLPSHLITFAGANHGSTLAQVGKSVLGYVQKVISKHIINVGQRVLAELDYGSDFLLKLNTEWLEVGAKGKLNGIYVFSIGGDSIGGDPSMHFLWQTHEPGSDNTVRISGANLNYSIVKAQPDAYPPSFELLAPHRPVPHLILAGYSHFGPQSGILGNVHKVSDPPMAAAIAALSVTSDAEYSALYDSWKIATKAWTTANPGDSNSTLVFSLFDMGGRPVDDCFIGILDRQFQGNALQALDSGSECVLPHSPIHNDVQRASYSFYINHTAYLASSPHVYHIEAHSNSDLIHYRAHDFVISAESNFAHLVHENEFTYVRVEMRRNTDNVYALYHWGAGLNLGAIQWMPFPDQGRVLLPPRP